MAQFSPEPSPERAEQAAFEELYRRHSSSLFKYFKDLVQDQEVAEKLVNATFTRVWSHLPNLRRPDRFQEWLYGIAKNVASDYLRRNPSLTTATVANERLKALDKALDDDLQQSRSPTTATVTSERSNAVNTSDDAYLLHIRVLEAPLTAQNLNTIISALTELSTKYWLIAKGRFADLIEYTQTHNGRFAEEAHAVITKISYNSPFNMDWKVDISAPSVADALVTTIDGIAQRKERLEKTKLENEAKALEIKEAEQKIDQENQIALLEQEKQRLELESHRLEILEKELELQKKSIEYALEIAGKVIDTLQPGLDQAARAMAIQSVLPNYLQLWNVRGLELAPPPKAEETSD